VIPNVSKSSELVLKPWKFSSPRSKISVAHEEVGSKVLKSSEPSSAQSKISVAHEEVSIKELKSCESSQTGSKILITHENLTYFHMPQVIINTGRDKPSIDIVTTMGTDKGFIKGKYTTTENHSSLNDKP
jgi:hypothetical protein